MANYHDIFQKGQDDIVPLAMQAMKLKMDQEQFEMVKNQALKKIETENAVKERMSKLFKPKTEEVTLPEVKAPVVPSAFGGNVPQFGLPEMKVPRTVQPQPSPMEVLMATADLMKPEEFARAYTDIKGKPTVHSLAPGNILVDSAGNKLGENTNTKPESEKDQWSEPYMASAGGRKGLVQKNLTTGQIKPVLQDVSTTIHVTNNNGRGNQANDLTPDAIRVEGIKYAMTGVMPPMGMGSSGIRQKIINSGTAYLIEQGINPTDVPAIQAGFKSTTATYKTLLQSTKQFSAFEKAMLSNMEYAVGLSSKYGRTSFPSANAVINAIRTHTGDPQVVELGTAIYAAAMEFEKIRTAGTAITSAELSQHAQEKAEEIINKAQTHKQLQASLQAMKIDAGNVMKARRDELSILESEMKNNPFLSKDVAQTAQPKTRDISTAVTYLKSAKNREAVKGMIKELNKKGWTREELHNIASQAGY
jgi:hypothetical protein